jgi:hypothetical protein
LRMHGLACLGEDVRVYSQVSIPCAQLIDLDLVNGQRQ